jgi:hypothetical protein
MSDEHQDASLEGKHIKTGGTEGGACLTRHAGRQENNSCSHIWQAVVRAETDDKKWYKAPAYDKLIGKRFKTGARRTARDRSIFPRGMTLSKEGPKPGDWDPGKGQNFKDWRIPYWHNAHHIVPNAVLKGSMMAAAEDAGDPRIKAAIESGLLLATYNLNHKINMVILPMGREVAAGLDLPRHLVGDNAGPGEKKEFRSHKNYSDEVEKRVVKVMQDFVSLFDEDPNEHQKPPNELAKEQLEKCSSDVRKSIKDFGAAKPGAPLVSMPQEMFQEQ